MKPLRDKIPKIHRHAWLWEPLEAEAGFVLRTMFGAKAAYLDGRLVLCFCAGKEPWRGVLVPTDRTHHDALRAEFPELIPHSVLAKWLYVPESADAFERVAQTLVKLARRRDQRVGVLPQPKKPRGRAVSARSPRRSAR